MHARELKLLGSGTTALKFGDRPLIIGFIRTIELWMALLFENRQRLL